MTPVNAASDPSICNTLFASFICKQVFDGHSVLEADDRVMCEDDGHVALQNVSIVLIALVACGVPIGVAAFLHQAHRSRPAIDVGMQSRVASDFNMDPKQAKSLIRDIQFSSSHSFLVATYRSGSPMFMWESIDSKLSLSHISFHKTCGGVIAVLTRWYCVLLYIRLSAVTRKLLLVGLILMVGRGSVLQLGSALFVAIAFVGAQIQFQPFKLPLDNLLRFSTELHTVMTILISFMIKADTHVLTDGSSSRRLHYDIVMVGTFIALVVLPFLVVISMKVMKVRRLMGQALEDFAVQDATTGSVYMALQRFQLGLQSAADRELVTAYLDKPSAGTRLWREKVIASHLTPEEIRDTLTELEGQLPKSQALGYGNAHLFSSVPASALSGMLLADAFVYMLQVSLHRSRLREARGGFDRSSRLQCRSAWWRSLDLFNITRRDGMVQVRRGKLP